MKIDKVLAKCTRLRTARTCCANCHAGVQFVAFHRNTHRTNVLSFCYLDLWPSLPDATEKKDSILFAFLPMQQNSSTQEWQHSTTKNNDKRNKMALPSQWNVPSAQTHAVACLSRWLAVLKHKVHKIVNSGVARWLSTFYTVHSQFLIILRLRLFGAHRSCSFRYL